MVSVLKMTCTSQVSNYSIAPNKYRNTRPRQSFTIAYLVENYITHWKIHQNLLPGQYIYVDTARYKIDQDPGTATRTSTMVGLH